MTNYKLIFKFRNSKIYLVILLLFIYHLSFIIYHLPKAYAQSISLSISPPLLEVMIKPGKSITQIYKITNDGEPVTVTLKLSELGINGIKEESNFIPEKWITLISNDISFDKAFLLKEGKTAEFILRINPPAGTPEQDYYRALVFTTTPAPFTDTTMSSFSQNLVSPLLISVTGTGILAKGAQITRFTLPKILDSFDPLVADIEVKNSGKNYFRPVGKITLTGPVGRGSYDLVPLVILENQTRQLITQNIPQQGESVKTLYLPGFYIGRYKMELSFTLDESAAKMTEMKTFYALPWKGAVLLILLIIGIKVLKLPKLFKKDKK